MGEPNGQQVRENRARRWLRYHYGYLLRKSRARHLTLNNRGGYMVIDAATNTIVAGEKYDLELEDIEALVQKLHAAINEQEVD